MPHFFCSWCGSNKHSINTCPRRGGSSRYCWYCTRRGHTSEHCPRRFWNTQERELERLAERGEFDGVDYTR